MPKKNTSIERSLIQMLLGRYKTYGIVGRPVNRSDVQLKVQYGLALVQILDLDENKQILRTNCWPRYVSSFQKFDCVFSLNKNIFRIKWEYIWKMAKITQDKHINCRVGLSA